MLVLATMARSILLASGMDLAIINGEPDRGLTTTKGWTYHEC